MNENRTAFIEYIDEIVKELVAAHAEAQLQQDLKSYIGSLNQLAQFIQKSPSRNNLRQANNLLRIDTQLYVDIIQPALFKRLSNTIQ